MKKPFVLTGTLLALVLLVAACSPAAAPAVPTEASLPTTAPTTAPATVAVDTAVPPTDEPFPTPTVEELAAAPEEPAVMAAVSHADAPAGPNEYRFDSAEVVGATGGPQLVEFFTTW